MNMKNEKVPEWAKLLVATIMGLIGSALVFSVSMVIITLLKYL